MNIKRLYEFLLSNEAEEFINHLSNKDITKLNVIQDLKTRFSDYPVSELLTLIRLRKNAVKRIENADKYLFTTKGVEQSSSSQVAKYHANIFSKCKRVADLCCGNGIDLLHIAKGKDLVYALDLSKTALYCSRYNCKVNSLDNIIFINSKAEDFSHEIEGIFIDPDRRPEERRVIDGEDISPSFGDINKIIQNYKNVVVKLSPVFDYQSEHLPIEHTWEFISEEGVLKEILLCTGIFASKNIQRKAVLLPENVFIQNSKSVEVSEIKKFIYDIDPAIIRSGLVQDLAATVSAKLINKHLAILTSDRLIDSKFLTTYKVIDIFHYNRKSLQKFVKTNEIGNLVVKVKGFPDRPNQVLNRLKLKGKNNGIVYLIRMDKEFLSVIIERIS